MSSAKPKPRRPAVDQNFPIHLLKGYSSFRGARLAVERQRYEKLAEAGQKPATMLIACCDSRAAPEVIFDAAPGEIFVVRNVANLMPPHRPNGDFHGTSAALEFAVQALRVQNIVVMGHGRCGGIAAFRAQLQGEETAPLSPGDFIGKWISMLEPVAQKIERTEGESEEVLQRKLEEQSIRQSIENLKTFPCISILLERSQIALHGAWFDISNGELWVLDPESDEFQRPDV
jgi:carbonic anhydrase